MNLMSISTVNHALHRHSTYMKASCGLVWYLSSVHAHVLLVVCTVMFLMSGTRMSGCVFRQNDTIDTTMKNTEITPIT